MSKIAVLLFLLSLQCTNANAMCKNIYTDPQIFQKTSQKAAELQQALNKTKAKAALIARVGADVRQYGLYYTHAAIALKNLSKKNNPWTVVHLINPCGTTFSHIVAQSLQSFFLDDLFNHDFEVIVPSLSLQNILIKALEKTESKKIHDPRYSMIAHPFSTKFQNSNQWIIELIAAAKTGQYSRESAQLFLKKTHFKPFVFHVGLLEKIGALLFKKHISFWDHPEAEQRSNNYSVVTVDSIIDWLKINHQLHSVQQYIT